MSNKNKLKRGKGKKEVKPKIKTHQSVEGPKILPTNINPWLVDNLRWFELTTIVNLPSSEGHPERNRPCKRVQNIPYNSTNNKGISISRHAKLTKTMNSNNNNKTQVISFVLWLQLNTSDTWVIYIWTCGIHFYLCVPSIESAFFPTDFSLLFSQNF